MADRGVSETVGFVLVFALITLTVATVYVVGIDGLTDARDAEQLNNAERAFDVLADNMADLHRQDAPSRATEIKLAEAQLGFGEPTTMTVSVDVAGTPADTVEIAPLVYSGRSESTLVYEAGAVIRTDPGGAVMKRAPDMVFRADGGVVILPVVQTRATGSGGVGGSKTVLVRGTRAVSEVLSARTSGGYRVTVTVDTAPARAPVWRRYFEARLDDPRWNGNCDVVGTDADTVECSFDAERLYVTATRVDVAIT
ncbi:MULTISPECIES: DUF7289 family protein [Halorussus]|uniref:DUF7289 family protein n=1 Tax=Halorussus TaxID=1070314 RepID=UPI0020A0450A|nr:hypothetical protein [Halorussus vallis]USZ75544.1 hypothetical protein NGM07_19195 [Halorussus vallis]